MYDRWADLAVHLDRSNSTCGRIQQQILAYPAVQVADSAVQVQAEKYGQPGPTCPCLKTPLDPTPPPRTVRGSAKDGAKRIKKGDKAPAVVESAEGLYGKR